MALLQKMMLFMKEQYDKIICFIVLLGLVGSLVYLAVRMGTFRQVEEEHRQRIDRLKPSFEFATKVETNRFQSMLEESQNPPLIPAWTNFLFVPEKRVWCVDCKGPIPYTAMECPFCTAKQPRPSEMSWSRDTDKDGIPDLWEMHYSLDPNDPADAQKDKDGDGFINIVEFNAQPGTVASLDPDVPKGTMQGTDLNDPEDSPSYEAELCVSEIKAEPFNLLFKSVMKTPDGALTFGVNTSAIRPKTYFVKMNGEVEGFKLVAYEPKTESVVLQGSSLPRNVDVSVLTLKRGDKMISLTKGKEQEYSEYTGVLTFNLDKSTYPVKMGTEFELKMVGKKYKVLSIDGTQNFIVIERLTDGGKLTIRLLPLRSSNNEASGEQVKTQNDELELRSD